MIAIEPLTLSVGVGLIIGLLMAEFFGLLAGGMVVPGYIALNLTHPMTVILTLGVALLTYGFIKGLSSFMIIFGRRRIAITVLLAFILGMVIRNLFSHLEFSAPFNDEEYRVIGYIIPGLIAISIDRQGITATFATLLSISVIVRLFLILFIGPVLLQ